MESSIGQGRLCAPYLGAYISMLTVLRWLQPWTCRRSAMLVQPHVCLPLHLIYRCRVVSYLWLIANRWMESSVSWNMRMDCLDCLNEQAFLSYKYRWLARRRLGTQAPKPPRHHINIPHINPHTNIKGFQRCAPLSEKHFARRDIFLIHMPFPIFEWSMQKEEDINMNM